MAAIVNTEGVLGGKARLEGRRISVLQIAERALDLEQPPEQIADQLDVSLAEVHAALAYYYEHPDEMRRERDRRDELDRTIRDAAVEPPESVEQ